MPTFAELSKRMTDSTNQKTVLHYLVEHIDENFRPLAGTDALKILKTDAQLPVPQEAFEAVVTDILLKNIKDLDKILEEISGSTLQTQPPQPPAAITTEPISEPGIINTAASVTGPVTAAPVPGLVDPGAAYSTDSTSGGVGGRRRRAS